MNKINTYLGHAPEFDKYRHLPFDDETFQCRLRVTQTDNDNRKPPCVDCDRSSRETWQGTGIGYVVSK